jgi:hypothetical protein
MKKDSTIERLKAIILQVGQRNQLDQSQIQSIVALVDEIHRGGTLTDDYLLGIFEAIGKRGG